MIAWYYDNSFNCDACAHERFGDNLDYDLGPLTDNEGNSPQPIYWLKPGGEICGACQIRLVITP